MISIDTNILARYLLNDTHLARHQPADHSSALVRKQYRLRRQPTFGCKCRQQRI